MLTLVVADRDDVPLIEQDVAGHQDRVAEESRGDELLILGLVLELGHAPQLAEARHRREQPRGFGVRFHVALREDDRAVRVDARREEHRRAREGRLVESFGLVRRRDGVQVDDAEERLAAAPGSAAYWR